MVKKGKLVRSTVILFSTMVIASVFAGCSSKLATDSTPAPTATGTQNVKAQPLEPLEITMMNLLVLPEPPKADNPTLKAIETYTNTKLNVTWVPSAVYNDKMNATLASSSLPKVLMIADTKAPSIISSTRAGMFWDIGAFLKDYPNISKLNQQVFNNIAIDGKVYGIFRARPIARSGLVFRQDWLDKLGLKQPKTMDELYAILQAFTKKDPDGNGKEDTFGMSLDKNFVTGYMKIFQSWFGAPNGWEAKDGKFTPDFMTKEYLDSLNYLRKLFSEKLINTDFPVAPAAQDFINQGKAGVTPWCLCTIDGPPFADLYKANPNAKLDMVNKLTGPKGDRIPADPGYSGVFMFPKSSVKTESELKRILQFFDQMADEKMNYLMDYGVEGLHYKLDGGKPIVLDKDLYDREVSLYKQLKISDSSNNPFGSDVDKKRNILFAENEKIAVPNPTFPLVSSTMAEKGNDLNKIIMDAATKYIYGEFDEAAWNKAIDQWKKAGGDKVIEEYAAEVAKSKK
ncbi:MAG: putative multiple sugar transport system substrate-binding protein YtcQ [Paenibacillus sp.]|nr:putative multiple sugar transport system substrate-binding protein YtcQ [Paenibacillus sp.]